MPLRLRVPGLARTWRPLWHALSALATAIAAGAARLAYRRREVTVIALLAASLLGGLGVETWHGQAPQTLARLEAERPSLAAVRAARARPPRQRRTPPQALTRSLDPAAVTPPAPLPTPETPLDLNHATPAELARLPGIGPRLAERIVAHRIQLGGRFGSPEDLATVPGLGRRKATLVQPLVMIGGSSPARELAAPETPPGPAADPEPIP